MRQEPIVEVQPQKILELWQFMWPGGIPVNSYDKALRTVQLMCRPTGLHVDFVPVPSQPPSAPPSLPPEPPKVEAKPRNVVRAAARRGRARR